MNEPRYQASKFVGPDRNEQIVIRADSIDDFRTQIEAIKTMGIEFSFAGNSTAGTTTETNGLSDPRVNPGNSIPEASTDHGRPAEPEESSETFCKSHGREMKERVNKRTGGTFYDHRRKNPTTDEWEMCSGDGVWKSSNF